MGVEVSAFGVVGCLGGLFLWVVEFSLSFGFGFGWEIAIVLVLGFAGVFAGFRWLGFGCCMFFGGGVFGVFVFGLGFRLVACFGCFVMDVLWVVLWVCVWFVKVGISTTMIV